MAGIKESVLGLKQITTIYDVIKSCSEKWRELGEVLKIRSQKLQEIVDIEEMDDDMKL